MAEPFDNDRYLKSQKMAEELLPLWSDYLLLGKSKKSRTKAHYKELATALLMNHIYHTRTKVKPGRPKGPLEPRIKLYLTINDEMRNSRVGVGRACANVFDRIDHGCIDPPSLKTKYLRERKYLWKFFTGPYGQFIDSAIPDDALLRWFLAVEALGK